MISIYDRISTELLPFGEVAASWRSSLWRSPLITEGPFSAFKIMSSHLSLVQHKRMTWYYRQQQSSPATDIKKIHSICFQIKRQTKFRVQSSRSNCTAFTPHAMIIFSTHIQFLCRNFLSFFSHFVSINSNISIFSHTFPHT